MTPRPSPARIVTAGSLSGSSRGSPASPVQYRVEERTRTIYIQSDLHPSLWAPGEVEKMFDVAGSVQNPALMPTSTQSSPADSIHRSKSVTEKQIFIFPTNSATSESCSEPPPSPLKPAHYFKRHPARSEGSLHSVAQRTQESSKKKSGLGCVRPKILFYHKHDPYYGFTNFSSHPVIYMGKRYPTSEHLFQSFKFQDHRPNLAEHIRTCSERPSIAFSEARRFQPEVRKDWNQVNIQKMDETIFHKFTQHKELLDELLATGDAELIEDSDKDSFWGIGPDGKGRNELGKALERLRSKLRGR